MMITEVRLSSLALLAACLVGSSILLAADAPLDAARLRTGRFTYEDSQSGHKGSLSTITITRLGAGEIRFTADFPSFDQSWSAEATRSLAPIRATLKMRTRDGRRYEMNLKYSDHHVIGRAITGASADGKQPKIRRSVEGTTADRTVDQRIDWATVMAANAQPDETFSFAVYDASTGTSRVTCKALDAGTMVTPVGSFHAIKLTYVVEKQTGTETYTVYATADLPRMMLREDLPGELVSRLVKVDP